MTPTLGANLCQGAGNANGIGALLDVRGDDSYRASGTSQGRASEAAPGSLREIAFSLGLLADGGGRNRYEGTEDRSPRSARTTPRFLPPNPARTQLGIFADLP